MRLTLTDDNGLAYSVEFDRWDALQHNRARWRWEIAEAPAPDMHGGRQLVLIASGDDLTTVVDTYTGLDYAEALGALLTFLAAALESGPDGENGHLFPPAIHQLNFDAGEVTALAHHVGAFR